MMIRKTASLLVGAPLAAAIVSASLASAYAAEFDGVWVGRIQSLDIKMMVNGPQAELVLHCTASADVTAEARAWKLPISATGSVDAWMHHQHEFARRHVRVQLPAISLEGSGKCGNGKTTLVRQ